MSSYSELQELFRPVGLRELKLIHASGMREFPPRLPEQPIFYPVLNLEYARQIARDWNTNDEANGAIGFVTRFAVAEDFLARYEVQTVGGREHQELWVPAEDLAELNRHIIGKINVVEVHCGEGLKPVLDPNTNLPLEWTPR